MIPQCSCLRPRASACLRSGHGWRARKRSVWNKAVDTLRSQRPRICDDCDQPHRPPRRSRRARHCRPRHSPSARCQRDRAGAPGPCRASRRAAGRCRNYAICFSIRCRRPVWARDAAGRLIFVNSAYTRAVEAENPTDAVARELELLDQSARTEVSRARLPARRIRWARSGGRGEACAACST